MKAHQPTLIACTLLLWLVALAPLAAQDTRGGLLAGTKVLIDSGELVAVEDLAPGSMLVTADVEKGAQPVRVVAVRRLHTDTYFAVRLGLLELRATGSQRVVLASGRLVRLDTVQVGDKLRVWGPNTPPAPVVSIRVYPANLVVFDLTTDQHRTFVGDGLALGD